MISTILEKCLEELSNETPRLDYIRGMLEVLLASQEKVASSKSEERGATTATPNVVGSTSTDKTPEEILDMMAKARLNDVKAMSKLE
jgi:hypothetical protein